MSFEPSAAHNPKMSKIPTSGSKPSAMSRLAPPGSLSKRPREGSMDLESGMEAKKVKTEKAGAPASNLSKSKSKSMMSIAPTGEFLVAILLFRWKCAYFLERLFSIPSHFSLVIMICYV